LSVDNRASAMIYSALKRFTSAFDGSVGKNLQRSSPMVRNAIAVFAAWAFLAENSSILLAQAPSQLIEHQHAAQQAEAGGDFETAIREYRILTKAMPDSAELESNLGVALYFHHDLALAKATLRRAIKLKPGLYSPHLFLGLVESRESQHDAAAAELEAAVKINDADPMAHTWLAYAYIAQSHYQRAIEQLLMAASEQPLDVDVAYALGRCYLELGKQATTMLLKVAPDGGRTWQLAAEQAELQGNTEKARNFYLQAFQRRDDIESVRAKVIALNGSLPHQDSQPGQRAGQEDALYNQVREYERESKAAFERISAIDPDSYRAHQILADADVAADRLDDAILEYENVLQRNPDLPGIHGVLCDALSRTAQQSKAITECETEIKLSPLSAEAYVQAARVHLLSQNYDRADALLQKARTLDNPPIALYKYLGEVSFNQKQYQAAVTNLKRYLAIESKDSSGFYLLSRAYKSLGDMQQMKAAIAEYKSAAAHTNRNEAEWSLDALRADQTSMEHDQKDFPEL
jgi:predicted Zn-dependent protease